MYKKKLHALWKSCFLTFHNNFQNLEGEVTQGSFLQNKFKIESVNLILGFVLEGKLPNSDTCALSESSVQPRHPLSLIEVCYQHEDTVSTLLPSKPNVPI